MNIHTQQELILNTIENQDVKKFHQLISFPQPINTHLAQLITNQDYEKLLEIIQSCIQHERANMLKLFLDELNYCHQATFQIDPHSPNRLETKKYFEFIQFCQSFILDLIHQNKMNYFIIIMEKFDELLEILLTMPSSRHINMQYYNNKFNEFRGKIAKNAILNLNLEILQSLRILDEQAKREYCFLYTDKNGLNLLHHLFNQWSNHSETNAKIIAIFSLLLKIAPKDIGHLLTSNPLNALDYQPAIQALLDKAFLKK